MTVETDSEHPLPPPKEVARKLRVLAIQTVQSWHSSYGGAYKKLTLGYHFLKKVKKVRYKTFILNKLLNRYNNIGFNKAIVCQHGSLPHLHMKVNLSGRTLKPCIFDMWSVCYYQGCDDGLRLLSVWLPASPIVQLKFFTM